MKNYDVIIIGSGQAGSPLAFECASQNKSVAFIEKERFGGTCLNDGCTPTKAYAASAKRIFDAKTGKALGLNIPEGISANLSAIKNRKDELVGKSVNSLKAALHDNENIDVYEGEAFFDDSKTIVVNDEKMQADKMFINVGARSRIPEVFNNVNYLTKKEMLELTEIPEHLIIVGGSFIGLEFGQMFRRFGSEVTVIEKSNRLVAHEDEDISETVKEILQNEGIRFRFNADCVSASQQSEKSVTVSVNCSSGKEAEISGSHLLLAVGRVPNTDILQLENTKIETDKNGYIITNDFLETTQSDIYALGDCNGKGAFTHTSYNDYEIVAANLFSDKKRKVTDRIKTYAMFIDPPLGRAGKTLAQAKTAGENIKTAYRKMSDVARAREKGETYGFMRAVIDRDTDKILGASILGVGGDEVISAITNVMYADMPYTLIRDSVQIHPTVSELVPTMLESLQNL
jgi:pyruvate/2-oxoglutarate dehydrogenase complex dihydrolipoamide dehydrogenase (E3) component